MAQRPGRRVPPIVVVAAPALGNYGSKVDLLNSGTNPCTTTSFDTQASGSSLVIFSACYLNEVSSVGHNKTGTVANIGQRAYTVWGPYGARADWVQNLAGGTGQTASLTMNAGRATDEKTVMAVEVKNGQTLQASNFVEVPASAGAQSTGGSVTTTGPAVLLCGWWGDSDVATPMDAAVSAASAADGWVRIINQTLDGEAHIQSVLAYRVVSGAGTYSCTWDNTPSQRAIVATLAIQA